MAQNMNTKFLEVTPSQSQSMGPPKTPSQQKLFKEFAICDLTQYKTGNIGLRWCLERDILSGKGKTICGNKHCPVDNQTLHSYEVNMTYQEADSNNDADGVFTVTKQALVKVNLCNECAMKLNYKKIKDKLKKKHKKDKKNKKKKNSHQKKSKGIEESKESETSSDNSD